MFQEKKHAYGKAKVLNNCMPKVILPRKDILDLLKRKPLRKERKERAEAKDADISLDLKKVNTRNVEPKKDVK